MVTDAKEILYQFASVGYGGSRWSALQQQALIFIEGMVEEYGKLEKEVNKLPDNLKEIAVPLVRDSKRAWVNVHNEISVMPKQSKVATTFTGLKDTTGVVVTFNGVAGKLKNQMVETGSTVTIIPKLEGYTFKPAQRKVKISAAYTAKFEAVKTAVVDPAPIPDPKPDPVPDPKPDPTPIPDPVPVPKMYKVDIIVLEGETVLTDGLVIQIDGKPYNKTSFEFKEGSEINIVPMADNVNFDPISIDDFIVNKDVVFSFKARRLPPPNTDPVVYAGTDQIITEGQSLMLDGRATDADGDSLLTVWDVPSTAVIGNKYLLKTAVTNLPVGVHTVTLTADDKKGGKVSDSLLVTVLKKIVEPVPDPKPDPVPPPVGLQNWSDPKAWPSGKVPTAEDSIVIDGDRKLLLDVQGVVGDLICKDNAQIIYKTGSGKGLDIMKGSALFLGKSMLKIHEPSPFIKPKFLIHNIDESKVVGTTDATMMDFVATDRGFYFMEQSKLDAVGSEVIPYIRAAGSIAAKSMQVEADIFPRTWNKGDEISIVPTEFRPYGYGQSDTVRDSVLRYRWLKGFEVRELAYKPLDETLDLSFATAHEHPQVLHRTAEILNLTRNITIGGTVTGNAHLFYVSTTPFVIENIEFRYMGQMKQDGTGVLGRYALHFHHNGWALQGCVVKNCVARDLGNKAFVPHAAHGVTFIGCIAYNYRHFAFWWDEGHKTNKVRWIDCVAANAHWQGGVSGGFELGTGYGCECIGCIAVGASVGGAANTNKFGFTWQANNEQIWKYIRNLGHNNMNALGSWQNTPNAHIIENSEFYNNDDHDRNGAYLNAYSRKNLFYFGCGRVKIKATGRTANYQFWQNIRINSMYKEDQPIMIIHAPMDVMSPIICINWDVKGYNKQAIMHTSDRLKNVAFVNCDFEKGIEFENFITYAENSNTVAPVKVQTREGKAYEYLPSGRKEVVKFAPDYGDGVGLTTEWFNNTNFEGSPQVVKIEQTISVPDSQLGIWHNIDYLKYSARYLGMIQPQYSEQYTFGYETKGSVKVWIEDKLVVDKSTGLNLPVDFVKGKMYKIKVEHVGNSRVNWGGFTLGWQSKTQLPEPIQHTQLYPSLN